MVVAELRLPKGGSRGTSRYYRGMSKYLLLPRAKYLCLSWQVLKCGKDRLKVLEVLSVK